MSSCLYAQGPNFQIHYCMWHPALAGPKQWTRHWIFWPSRQNLMRNDSQAPWAVLGGPTSTRKAHTRARAIWNSINEFHSQALFQCSYNLLHSISSSRSFLDVQVSFWSVNDTTYLTLHYIRSNVWFPGLKSAMEPCKPWKLLLGFTALNSCFGTPGLWVPENPYHLGCSLFSGHMDEKILLYLAQITGQRVRCLTPSSLLHLTISHQSSHHLFCSHQQSLERKKSDQRLDIMEFHLLEVHVCCALIYSNGSQNGS